MFLNILNIREEQNSKLGQGIYLTKLLTTAKGFIILCKKNNKKIQWNLTVSETVILPKATTFTFTYGRCFLSKVTSIAFKVHILHKIFSCCAPKKREYTGSEQHELIMTVFIFEWTILVYYTFNTELIYSIAMFSCSLLISLIQWTKNIDKIRVLPFYC